MATKRVAGKWRWGEIQETRPKVRYTLSVPTGRVHGPWIHINGPFIFSHYLASAYALACKHGNAELASFHSNATVIALLDFSQSMLDFFNVVDSRLILVLLYDSRNLVVNGLL